MKPPPPGVSGTIHGSLKGLTQEDWNLTLRISMRDTTSAVEAVNYLALYMDQPFRLRVEAGGTATIPDVPGPMELMADTVRLRRIAESLDAQEAVTYCGTDGCMHAGHQHDLSNRCLLCACRTFSSRPGPDDMLTRLRLALEATR